MANNNHFNLSLDTLAPSGSITIPGAYINANANLTINYGDATYMKIWRNGSAVGSKSDVDYPSSWENVSGTYLTDFSADGLYYYHMVLLDSLNNESGVIDSDQITFDASAPTISNFIVYDPDDTSKQSGITNNLTGNKFEFDYYDATSKVWTAQLTCANNISPINIDIHATSTSNHYEGTFDFLSGVADGLKTLQLTITDHCGNYDTDTATIVLDTSVETPVLVLKNSSGTSITGTAINYREINISLTSADTDIVGYKIWEGSTEPSSWDSTGIVSGQPLNILKTGHELANTQGVHTINAKVKDSAGTIKAADAATVTLDTIAPALTITSNNSYISDVSGFNTATLTLTCVENGSGVASWSLKCGNTEIGDHTVSGDPVPSTFSLTSANSMVEGDNTITFTVTDNASNSTTATVHVIFDDSAPIGSINQLNTWYNAPFDVTISFTDYPIGSASGTSNIYIWKSTVQNDETVPQGLNPISVTSSPRTISANSIGGSFSQNAANYIHVKFIDAVGNASFDHEQFGYDNVAPTTPSAHFEVGAYNTQSATLIISSTDATSGLSTGALMLVDGDITDGGSWEAFNTRRDVTLTTGDGNKYVTVIVKDVAGNASDQSAQAVCELDTTVPASNIELYEANGTTSKPNTSAVATCSVRIWPSNDDGQGPYTYKLWGDFTAGSQSASGTAKPATGTTFTPDSGQTYQTVSGLYCTSGDGVKAFYIEFTDNAGNVSEPTHVSFTYDTTAPEVDVRNIDYHDVSKEHSLRRSSKDETISGKYCDEVHFTIHPDSVIQAWKVCCYASQAAALAGDHTDPAIPTTNGSLNMSGSNISSSADISCLIKGADFELAASIASGESSAQSSDSGEYDGAYIVVIYIQDLAGTWNAKAVFPVQSN